MVVILEVYSRYLGNGITVSGVHYSFSVSVTPDYVPPFANVDLATLDMVPWNGSAVSTKNRNKGKMGEYIASLSLSEPHWTNYTYCSISV